MAPLVKRFGVTVPMGFHRSLLQVNGY